MKEKKKPLAYGPRRSQRSISLPVVACPRAKSCAASRQNPYRQGRVSGMLYVLRPPAMNTRCCGGAPPWKFGLDGHDGWCERARFLGTHHAQAVVGRRISRNGDTRDVWITLEVIQVLKPSNADSTHKDCSCMEQSCLRSNTSAPTGGCANCGVQREHSQQHRLTHLRYFPLQDVQSGLSLLPKGSFVFTVL